MDVYCDSNIARPNPTATSNLQMLQFYMESEFYNKTVPPPWQAVYIDYSGYIGAIIQDDQAQIQLSY